MSDQHKAILIKGNAAIAEGNYEGFLSLCTEDTQWIFVGDTVLDGKESVREWMKKTYVNPPKVTVTNLIAEGDLLVATGEVSTTDKKGKETVNSYCDIWEFRGEEIFKLRAFVI
jgi:uncharacterized protein (TIGR02246 family)